MIKGDGCLNKLKNFIKDTSGDAVVEATILFPVLIMIFAGLVLLSMYLPTRAVLQQATQYAATAIATEKSDTWIFFDENNMEYYFEKDKSRLDNVYITLIKSILLNDDKQKSKTIVENIENSKISTTSGDLKIEFGIINYIIYKEIIVTATRTIPSVVNLSFVGFPREIPITVTSIAVVQNGDEFVRNMDIAVDLTKYIDDKYNISEVFSGVTDFLDKFKSVFGWE